VKQGQNLIDIETDKVMMELPAPGDGVLAEIVRDAGSAVKSGELIAHHRHRRGQRRRPAPAPPAAPAAKTVVAASAGNGSGRAQAMPSAAKLLSEQGIAVGEVDGSGRGGRVTKGDVLAHVAAAAARERPAAVAQPAVPAASAPQPQVALAAGRSANRRADDAPAGARRRARWSQSQQGTATLTTFNEVDMQPVIELRKRYGERFEKDHGVEARLHGRSSSRRRAPR
jgi:2-oxoglutarate dehydrogenase E2 component (dihydrolipoamide succinyltransferase)